MMLKMDDSKYKLNLESIKKCKYLLRLSAENYNEMTGSDFEFVIDFFKKRFFQRE